MWQIIVLCSHGNCVVMVTVSFQTFKNKSKEDSRTKCEEKRTRKREQTVYNSTPPLRANNNGGVLWFVGDGRDRDRGKGIL